MAREDDALSLRHARQPELLLPPSASTTAAAITFSGLDAAPQNQAPLVPPPSPKRHVCPDCGRSYKAAETLNRHRKNHLATSDHVCDTCGAAFKRKDLLDRHLQIHVNRDVFAPRSRKLRACTRCSRLKTRCDNLMPCTRCARGQHACTYVEVRSRARTERMSARLVEGEGFVDQSHATNEGSLRTADEEPSDDSRTNGEHERLAKRARTQSPQRSTPDVVWSSEWSWPGAENGSRHASDNSSDNTQYAASDRNSGTPGLDGKFNLSNAALSVHSGSSPASSALSSYPFDSWYQSPSSSSFSPVTSSGRNEREILPSPAGTFAPTSHPESLKLPILRMHDEGRSARRAVVDELMHVATSLMGFCNQSQDRSRFWKLSASKVESAFGLQGIVPPDRHAFDYFLALFFDHFHVHWPIPRRQEFIVGNLPPHQYLLLCSIGAAYGSGDAPSFHQMMLDALREPIIMAGLRPHPDDAVLPLIHSLALIQVSTLYFGNRKAFTYVPQVGNIISGLCRKLGLFDENSRSLTSISPLEAELRRRLAYGVMMLEVYVSLLLGTRPLVSFEEMHVRRPSLAFETATYDPANDIALLMSSASNADSADFSALVSQCLDENVRVLPELRFDELELVLFGLQQSIWQCSQDSGMVHRLSWTLQHNCHTSPRHHSSSIQAGACSWSAASLAPPLPAMDDRRDLRYGYSVTLDAMHKWRAALAAVDPPHEANLLPRQRQSILASKLLFGISGMKLHADLPGLHRVAISCVRHLNLPRTNLVAAYRWALSPSAAQAALESACSIWSLIAREVRRPDFSRTELSVLGHVALLHAAIVVWVFAGAHDDLELASPQSNHYPSTSTLPSIPHSVPPFHYVPAAHSPLGSSNNDSPHIISRLDAFGSPPPCPSQPPPSQPPGARRSTVAHLLNPTPPLPPPTLNSLSILTMPPHHLALLRANNAPLMQTFTALLRDIHPSAPNVGTGYTAYQGLVEGLANTPLPLMS